MTGRIDQVELIGLTILGLVRERHALGLDRDPTLTLDIHRIENLRRHFPFGQSATGLNESVRQRRLAVIDVRDDREISNIVLFSHNQSLSFSARNCEPPRR